MSSPYKIRVYGDPVLRKVAKDVQDIDGKLVKVCDAMLQTMYDEPGIGLAAPQVGIQKRFFVYDLGDGPAAIINPVVHETSGEWLYEEGCLSVPGLHWEITRPKEVHITGYGLDGEEISIEADELASRAFQHEMDHLDGILLVDRLDEDTRKDALITLREMYLDLDGSKEAKEKDGPLSRLRPRKGGLTLP